MMRRCNGRARVHTAYNPTWGAMSNFAKFPCHMALIASNKWFARKRAPRREALGCDADSFRPNSYSGGMRARSTEKSQRRSDAGGCAPRRREPTVPHEPSGGKVGEDQNVAVMVEKRNDQLPGKQNYEDREEQPTLTDVQNPAQTKSRWRSDAPKAGRSSSREN